MAHLSTINADGSPQVTVIWIGLDGDDLVSGHMSWHVKLRKIERDPRVVLSFDSPRMPGVFIILTPCCERGPPSSRATRPGVCSTAWQRSTCPLMPCTRGRRVVLAISCATPWSVSAALAPGR